MSHLSEYQTTTMKITGKSQVFSGAVPLAACLVAGALILLIGNLTNFNQMAEARYLPTRSDTSEVEALKKVIRELLIETAADNRRPQSFSRRFQQQQPFGLVFDPSQSSFMQRRAAELSISSSNGDEPENYLMGSLAPDSSGKSAAQLFSASKADRR